MRSKLKSFYPQLLPYLIYMILAVFLIPYVQYDINAVGISLISVAQEYAAGDIKTAINATWSPLFSILTIPFILSKIDPLMGAKILQIILGLVLIFSCDFFLRKSKISTFVRKTTLYSLIPLALYFSFYSINADLLLINILILYITLISSKEYKERPVYGVWVGILGGISYLTRTYAFPFFIIHFTLLNIFFFLRSRPKQAKVVILGNYIKGMLVFFAIASLWIWALYQKYHYVMIGSVGTYSVMIQNPIFKGASEHSLFSLGLIAPPTKNSVSIYEDLTYSLPLFSQWSPLENKNHFGHFLQVIYSNSKNLILTLSSFSIVFLPLTIGLPFLLRWLKPSITFYIFTFSGFLFGLGFLPFEYIERHFWFPVLTLFLCISLLANNFLKKKVENKFSKLVIIITLFTFLINPLIFITNSIFPPDNLVANAKQMYFLSRQLSDQGVKGHTSSNKYGFYSLRLTYYLGSNSQYFSVDKEQFTSQRARELHSLGIDYYFFWKENNSDIKQVPDTDIPKIYEDEYLVIFNLTTLK